jgi:hypothetical protein
LANGKSTGIIFDAVQAFIEDANKHEELCERFKDIDA